MFKQVYTGSARDSFDFMIHNYATMDGSRCYVAKKEINSIVNEFLKKNVSKK